MPQPTGAEPRQQLRSIAIVVALGVVGALVGVILWGGVGAAVGAAIGLAVAAVRLFRGASWVRRSRRGATRRLRP